MKYKFENLDVWKISLELVDDIYSITDVLPESEKFNLKSQIIRAATSINLNIAEGSTSQSNSGQKRFLGYSIRSLLEVVACLRLIERRGYLSIEGNTELLCEELFIKLQAFKKSLV